ncbi:MAG: hypothetical protein JG761_552 [Proteiniphilum sp.]|nr:hypothetical protein [Proteiniphilum sp.]
MNPDNFREFLIEMAMNCIPDVFFNFVVSISFYKNGKSKSSSFITPFR